MLLGRRSWKQAPPADHLEYEGPEDPMQRNAFDEAESNRQRSDRPVPDTRDPRFDGDIHWP